MKMRFVSMLTLAAISAFGFTQFSGSSVKAPASKPLSSTAAKHGCRSDQDCHIGDGHAYYCSGGGLYSEGTCTRLGR
jgi:hypothetical protein